MEVLVNTSRWVKVPYGCFHMTEYVGAMWVLQPRVPGKAVLFYCPNCGVVWGRMIPPKPWQNWIAYPRECKAHGKGHFIESNLTGLCGYCEGEPDEDLLRTELHIYFKELNTHATNVGRF